MNRLADTNVWNDARSFDATADESECAEEMLGKLRLQRWVTGLCVAAAVFAVVWFGLRLLVGAVS